MVAKLSLEEKLSAVNEFLVATKDTGWSVAILRNVLLELKTARKENGELYAALSGVKEGLSAYSSRERQLMEDYKRAMWIGEFRHSGGVDWLSAMIAETRKLRGLPEGAPMTMDPDSEEWKLVSASVKAESERLLEQEKGKRDITHALTALVGTVKARINAYPLLLQARDVLVSSLGINEVGQGYYWTQVHKAQSGIQLDESVIELFPYVKIFPERVKALTDKYQHPILLRLSKELAGEPQLKLKQ